HRGCRRLPELTVCPMSFLSMSLLSSVWFCFFSTGTATTQIYTLSLHDALPIYLLGNGATKAEAQAPFIRQAIIKSFSPLIANIRSEEHTSELQSRFDLVCRLLLEKKKRDGIAPRDGHQ